MERTIPVFRSRHGKPITAWSAWAKPWPSLVTGMRIITTATGPRRNSSISGSGCSVGLTSTSSQKTVLISHFQRTARYHDARLLVPHDPGDSVPDSDRIHTGDTGRAQREDQ